MENQAPQLWDSQELLDKAWKQLTDDGMKLRIAKTDGSEGIQKLFDTIVAGGTLELELVLAKAQLLLLKMSHEKQASQLASKKK